MHSLPAAESDDDFKRPRLSGLPVEAGPTSMADLACSRCGGKLDPGFYLDSDGRRLDQSTWTPGERWAYVLQSPGERQRFPVTTYRCRQCGYLESYAYREASGSDG